MFLILVSLLNLPFHIYFCKMNCGLMILIQFHLLLLFIKSDETLPCQCFGRL